MEATVFTAGECPICPGFGIRMFVRPFLSQKVFVFCPACASCWEPPEPSDIHDLRSLEEMAPEGLTLPSRIEIEQASFGGFIVDAVPYSEWGHALEEYVRE